MATRRDTRAPSTRAVTEKRPRTAKRKATGDETRAGGSPVVDLYALGARVVSVYGPFNSLTLIELPTEVAEGLFPDGLDAAAPSLVVEATERDLARIRKRDRDLADSALAASAVAMAREIENPFNSATSKSMCQARLADAMQTLRGLAPPEEVADGIDEIADRRAKRRARITDATSARRP